jgi:carbon monoxide dehydrogenase subunit G
MAMKLEDQFRVDVPLETAWNLLLDVERIAPCLPGAQLQEVAGDEYRGIVKVKVGAILAQYKGTAKITEADEAARRIVIKADGRDTRGQGNASATVTAQLEPDGTGTRVSIETDLNVTGKVAQFGRGIMAEVSTKLLGQFVNNLERDVLGGRSDAAPAAASTPPPVSGGSVAAEAPAVSWSGDGASSAAPAASTAAPTAVQPAVRRIDSPEPEPVDLMEAAGPAVAKRVLPLVVGAAIVAFILWRRNK